MTSSSAKIRIEFFAVLREQAGLGAIEFEGAGMTPREIYARLAPQYGFILPPDRIRFAVGDEYVSSDAPLKDGDEVLFIPPVAGG